MFKAANNIDDLITGLENTGRISDISSAEYQTANQYLEKVLDEANRTAAFIEQESLKAVAGVIIAD